MSLAQIKHTFLSILHRQSGESETFGEKVRRTYREGKLQKQIEKAEMDYAEGRALDSLY